MKNECYIELEINDDWLMTNYSLLFDRNDFQMEIIKLREEFGIKKLLTLNEFNDWMREKDIGYTLDFPGLRTMKFMDKVSELVHKYGRYKHFESPVAYAILCGVYKEESIKTGYADILKADEMNPNDILLAIVITPETELSEIEDIYRQKLPELKEQFRKKYQNDKYKVFDTRQSIREHRQMFWLNKRGVGTTELGKRFCMTKQGADRAIKAYKELLK